MINHKKYAVLVSNYPSDEHPNVFGFVHSRVRSYIQEGYDIDVYRINSFQKTYTFEGVTVYCKDADSIKRAFDEIEYAGILIHFLDKKKIDIVGDRKCLIWVHGFEALSWKRRLYNLNPRFPLYMLENTRQLSTFKKYAKTHPDSKFIFVSDWMYNITCRDIGFKIQNYEIIHNYIDSSIFEYNTKTYEHVKKLLLIRSFANKKYANDITVKLIRKLSKKPYFKELKILIYGEGKFFKRLTDKIKDFDNVEIHNNFISQQQIADIQKDYGVFLCPTRQDAQGVSMCEAMSSGLVPLTSYSTAIPQFVEDGKEGLLCSNNSIDSFVKAYERLYNEDGLFESVSQAASKRVQKQCSFDNTVAKEMELMNKM